MQNGSLIRAERQKGPSVWEFRWRERAGNGKRTHRRIVLGSVDRLADEAAARQAVSALCIDINAGDARIKANITTVSDLTEHYRQRELRPDTVWKTYSTKVTYEGYLNKWILPRWGNYSLFSVSAGEVELWLGSLTLARASCATIRNLMSVLFNHGIRHEICDRNPIQLVRQSTKRKTVPVVLTPMEVQRLLSALTVREIWVRTSCSNSSTCPSGQPQAGTQQPQKKESRCCELAVAVCLFLLSRPGSL